MWPRPIRIAASVMDRVIAECRKDGVAEAWVGTDLDNQAVQRLCAGTRARTEREISPI
jgi:hypothetical protein